jgi:hypothetical protein
MNYRLEYNYYIVYQYKWYTYIVKTNISAKFTGPPKTISIFLKGKIHIYDL